MKKSELKPGTKVIASIDFGDEYDDEPQGVARYYPDDDNEPLIGVIRSQPASPGKVFVSWIEGDRTGEEEEVDIEVLSLASEQAALDKEFKVVEKQIKEKLKEAGKLVKEAHKMAKAAGARDLASMYDAVDPLVDAMDASGWRSSSWGC